MKFIKYWEINREIKEKIEENLDKLGAICCHTNNDTYSFSGIFKKWVIKTKEIVSNCKNGIKELFIVNSFVYHFKDILLTSDTFTNVICSLKDTIEYICSDINEGYLTMVEFSKEFVKVDKYLNELIEDIKKDDKKNIQLLFEEHLDIDSLLNKTFWYWNGDVYKCIYNKKTLIKALKEIYDYVWDEALKI